MNSVNQYKRNKKAVFHIEDDKTYILDEKNSEVIILNDTASFVWAHLERFISVSELAEKINDTYNTKNSLPDLKKLLTGLKKRSLVSLKSK